MISRRLEHLSAGNRTRRGRNISVWTPFSIERSLSFQVWRWIINFSQSTAWSPETSVHPVSYKMASWSFQHRRNFTIWFLLSFRVYKPKSVRSKTTSAWTVRISPRTARHRERRFLCLGEVLIKNWNPLPIETITENRTVTVQDILGDLMNMAALQIHISK